MTQGFWRTAFASVIGSSHRKNGTPCQDASGCLVIEANDGHEILLAVASDGAGTASRSDVGAQLAVQCFLRDFGEAAWSDSALTSIDRTFVEDWVSTFQSKIFDVAQRDGCNYSDYYCTLLAAVVGPFSATYLHIGDGAIVVGCDELGEYGWVVWPQHGEYANTTNFLLQKDASDALVFESGPAVSQLAIFTDGIERLVLDLTCKTVHSPAFRPIFNWLSGAERDTEFRPSDPIIAYLDSDYINQRTDDDKTLIVATKI